MYTRYHTIELKQTKKSVINRAFVEKDSQLAHYNGDIFSYLSSCTALQKKIADLFLKFRYSKKTKITNDYIAKTLNCSTKTVTRCTNKFHQDRFITKHQDNPYSPNHYAFNAQLKRGKHAYDYWYNNQSPKNQSLIVTHGIRIDHKNKLIFSCENVPQNNNRYLSSNLYLKRTITNSYAQAREGYGFFDNSNRKITAKGKIMNHSYSGKPTKDKSQPVLITQSIERLAKLICLDDNEQLKLIAFTDDALRYAIDYIEPIINGKKVLKIPVKNKVGWLISILNAFCKKNNIKPDWPRYFSVCDQKQIVQSLQSYDSKPLIVEKKEKPDNYLYRKWEEPKQCVVNFNEKINKLRKSISDSEYIIKNVDSFYKPSLFMSRELFLSGYKFYLQQDRKDLIELERNYEFTQTIN